MFLHVIQIDHFDWLPIFFAAEKFKLVELIFSPQRITSANEFCKKITSCLYCVCGTARKVASCDTFCLVEIHL